MKRFRCRHDNLRGIYGDEIMHRNWKRSMCINCRKTFDDLPPARNRERMIEVAPEVAKEIERLRAELARYYVCRLGGCYRIGSLHNRPTFHKEDE